MYIYEKNGKKIEYTITYKDNKYTYLRIRNGVANITTSKYTSKKIIIKLLDENFDNIYNRSLEKNYITNNLIDSKSMFLGQVYDVLVINSKNNRVRFDENKIIINAKSGANLEKLLDTFYKEQTLEIIEKLRDEIDPKFIIDGYNCKSIRVRRMVSRWGSCKTTTGDITINSLLSKLDVEFLKYVLYHEYAHLKFADHSKSYYNYLESKYPIYKETRNKLKKIRL